MARGKPKKRPLEDAPEGLSHNPFAALRGSGAPGAGSDAPKTSASSSTPSPDASQPNRAADVERLVVRKERTGRGGKTVTRVSGCLAEEHDLEALAVELKRALGCGASVEGDDVCVQGDQVERVAQILERGQLPGLCVSKVVRGN